jgi:hypothetical protein
MSPKKKPKPKTRTRHRSAITGRYVTEHYAKRHPKTTVKETDKVVRKRKKKTK